MRDSLTPHTTRQTEASGPSRFSYGPRAALATFYLSFEAADEAPKATDTDFVSLRYFATSNESLLSSETSGRSFITSMGRVADTGDKKV